MRADQVFRSSIPEGALPSVSHIFHAIRSTQYNGSPKHSAGLFKETGDIYCFSRGTWAISAFFDLVRKTTGKTTIRLFAPNFFCNGVLETLKKDNRLKVMLYPISDNLDPDWDGVFRLSERLGSPDIFLLVHYFGFMRDTEAALTYCAKVGAFLLEDCAHVTGPSPGVRIAGHGAIYSPRKVLPVPDGGLLVVKRDFFERRDPAWGCKTAHFGFSGRFRHSVDSLAMGYLWLLKKLAQLAFIRWDIPWSRPAAGNTHSSGLADSGRDFSMSIITERLMDVYARKIVDFQASRRRNYFILNQAVMELAPIVRPLFEEPNENACPYIYPLLINRDHAGMALFYLNRKGIPARTWPDLPPEVFSASVENRTAVDLHERLLTLPVHQSLLPKHLCRMAEILKNTVRAGKK